MLKNHTTPYHIAIAGTGYVGLSLAVLLSQHNVVTAVDVIEEKVKRLNAWGSPIQDEYIERYLAEAKETKIKSDSNLRWQIGVRKRRFCYNSRSDQL